MSDEKKKKEKKKEAYDKIREIDNKIYNIKLTFLELEQLRLWLFNIETEDSHRIRSSTKKRILERIVIALDQAQHTGDSV